MSDITIGGINPGAPLQAPQKTGGTDLAGTFDRIVDEAMGKLAQVQADADKAVSELTSGGDVTQAVLAMEQADMNFQLMVEVRNKLLSAYEEIMRMQV